MHGLDGFQSVARRPGFSSVSTLHGLDMPEGEVGWREGAAAQGLNVAVFDSVSEVGSSYAGGGCNSLICHVCLGC